jgi:hypothetical protein
MPVCSSILLLVTPLKIAMLKKYIKAVTIASKAHLFVYKLTGCCTVENKTNNAIMPIIKAVTLYIGIANVR